MKTYSWNGLATSTLLENEIAYVNSYLLGTKNFEEFAKAKNWVGDLNIKACTGLASKTDIDQLARLEEIEKAYHIITKSGKNEFVEGEEPKFTFYQLRDFLLREYQVSSSDPFVEGLMNNVFDGILEGSIQDINNRLSSQNFKHIDLATLEGLSALTLQEMQRRTLDKPAQVENKIVESISLNGGYSLYILLQDFSKLPQPLDYKFNPSVGKAKISNSQEAPITMEQGDDEYGKNEIISMEDGDDGYGDDEVTTDNSSEEYDDEAWGPMFNGRSSFSFDDGMDF